MLSRGLEHDNTRDMKYLHYSVAYVNKAGLHVQSKLAMLPLRPKTAPQLTTSP